VGVLSFQPDEELDISSFTLTRVNAKTEKFCVEIPISLSKVVWLLGAA
jgi:hypothetical protein